MSPLAELDAFSALARQPVVAWLEPGLVFAGWGDTEVVDLGTGPDRYRRAAAAARDRGPVLVTFTFDQEKPGSIAVIPSTLVRISGGEATLVRGATNRIAAPAPPDPLPRLLAREEDVDLWSAEVERAMTAIGAGEVEKVVLSRTVRLRFEAAIPVHSVTARLAAEQPDSHTFLIDGLVGSSPELLVSLREGEVRSVSMAGSADGTDQAAAADLSSPKTLVEHALAADSVAEVLAAHCSVLERLPPKVMRFSDISHLATSFRGRALEGTTITDLAAALHPTAAVSGTPRQAAIRLINAIEGHQRWRYAGPVGWIGPEGDGSLAIALRCAAVRSNEATLYSGAGLVAGSDPVSELAETDFKLRPMLRALGVV